MTTITPYSLLATRRKQNMLPQIAVALQLGISQAQYSNIENGYRQPNEEQAKKLVEMFELPHGYFDKAGEKA